MSDEVPTREKSYDVIISGFETSEAASIFALALCAIGHELNIGVVKWAGDDGKIIFTAAAGVIKTETYVRKE